MVGDQLRVPSVYQMTATLWKQFIRSLYEICRHGNGPRRKEGTESVVPNSHASIQEFS